MAKNVRFGEYLQSVTVDSSSSILATSLVTGLMGGATAGIGAYNQAGGSAGYGKTLSGQLKLFGG